MYMHGENIMHVNCFVVHTYGTAYGTSRDYWPLAIGLLMGLVATEWVRTQVPVKALKPDDSEFKFTSWNTLGNGYYCK